MQELNENFAAVLQIRTAARRHSTCLTVPGGPTFTYAELFDLAARMAAAIRDAGAEPGDRVLVQVEKSAEAIALYLGCLIAGTVHVPLNPAFTLDEVKYFIHDAGPSLIVTSTDRADLMATLTTAARLLTLDADGTGTLIDHAAICVALPTTDRDEHDLAALVYTSGTTGVPKGAMVTHANLRHNAWALYTAWDCSPDDVLLHPLPIFHVHGLFVALHCALLGGVPIHLLPRFDTDSVISLIPESTVMMGVPTHYNRLMAEPRFNAELCSGMRLFTSGSAPLSETSFHEFAERTGHQLCERYGMSEAGIITSNPYDGQRVAGTVGYPIPGYEVKVTGDDGQDRAKGECGLVAIRGPHLFSGYWRNQSATRESFDGGGWFTTGDIGCLSDDGRLSLEGRSSDMIISGGENIHPIEVEIALNQIEGIRESAVVGVPHADFGDAVVAAIVLEPGVVLDCDSLKTSLDASLVRYKHPRAVKVVDHLPRNAMGKVLRGDLRLRLAGLFREAG